MTSDPEMNAEMDVTDESADTTYVFQGADETHLQELANRWFEQGEQTWVRMYAAGHNTGFSLDAVGRSGSRLTHLEIPDAPRT